MMAMPYTIDAVKPEALRRQSQLDAVTSSIGLAVTFVRAALRVLIWRWLFSLGINIILDCVEKMER